MCSLPILKIEGTSALSKTFDQNVFSIIKMRITSKTEQIYIK